MAKVEEGHPKALYMLSFTEMWERFSFYGMRALLILYFTKEAVEHGLNWPEGSAGQLYGWYAGLVYFTPLFGGIIADQFLGQRRSIFIGGILMMLGQFALFAEAIPFDFGLNPNNGQPIILYGTTMLGLFLLVIGNGMFKPNISTIVGDLYEVGDKRRDSAFTIFYMGINAGAFLAPIVCGFIGAEYGFRYGFLAAGVGISLGQIIYMSQAQKLLGDKGMKPSGERRKKGGQKAEKVPLTKAENDRIAVILVLLVFVTVFWAGFEQAATTFNLYTEKYIDRTVFGFEIPASVFQSVNPLFILLLGPAFGSLWTRLAVKGKDPNIPVKMGLGLILLGLGFFLMVGAVFERGLEAGSNEAIKANLLWVVATYMLHTMGELCLSPIGLSMVTKLSPIKFASMLMGTWFLSSAVANIISGLIVGVVEQWGALSIFGSVAGFVIVLGLVLFAIARKLVTMMHGAQ